MMLLSPYSLVTLSVVGFSLQALAFSPHNPFLITGIVKRQNQIVFPPSNGPCLQNAGKEPLACTDPECTDIAGQGLCHIQTQEGFPVCGCCDAEQVACSACGGDAGGGRCRGTGRAGQQYQGCTCSADAGNVPIPDDDSRKACLEDSGQDTLSCDDSRCGGSTHDEGICDNKTPIEGAFYRYCSCCPKDKTIGCSSCGGDAGGGKCVGVPEYQGIKFQGCNCDVNGGGGIPPPLIFPFPIPFIGFFPPPVGTPRPNQPCQEGQFAQCSECEGKRGWCQSGPNAGCMCKNDCSAGEQPAEEEGLKCEDDHCQGQNEKCTVGHNEGCKCISETKCPELEGGLQCVDDICGGAVNGSIVSGCKGGSNGENKDCRCYQSTLGSDPYRPMTQDESNAQQAVLDDLADLGDSTPQPDRPNPADDLTCAPDSARSVDEWNLLADGTQVRPRQIFYMMRESLCSNKCELPGNIPLEAGIATVIGNGCEIAIGISGAKEIYTWRKGPASDLQAQDCYDSIGNITEKCINGGPNAGWASGPDEGEFFQAGVRPREDPGRKHSKILTNGLLPSFLVCESCGGDTNNGGKCSTGDNAGSICCPSGANLACTNPRCNADGGQCTGDLNGCLCLLNGRKRGSRRRS